MPRRSRPSFCRALRAARAAALFGLLPLASLPAQRLPFIHYSTDDGLAATQVWQMMEDHRGLLWIATTWGLNRFDGASFSTISVAQGLPSPTARVTLEDDAGNLWIGTNAGLARYDGAALESLAGRGGPFAATIWSSGKDRYGALWFGSDKGLISVFGGDLRTFSTADGLASNYAYGLLTSSDGALWIGSRGAGVSRCTLERGGRLGACRTFTTRDGLGSDAAHALAEGPDGTIFLGMRNGGLTRFDGTRFTTLHAKDGLPSDDVYALAVYGGDLLVGTDSGMAVCALPEVSPCRIWSEKNGLPDDGVRYFLVDHEGVLWIGAEGGLARLARRDVLSYDESQGLPDAHVYALASDGASGVWIGTFNGLAHLAIGAGGEPAARILREVDGLPSNWVWALLSDREGALWIGTESGLARLARTQDGTESFERWDLADGLAGDYVVALLEDRRGAIWAASTEGISRLERAPDGGRPKITAFGVEDGLPVPHVYALAEDRHGRIWAAHGEALSWFDGTRFRAVGAEAGLASPTTRSLGVDRSGALWVGGQQQVARLVDDVAEAPPRFAPLETGGALDGYLVLTIAENENGRLVLGTNRGVLTLDARGAVAEIVGRFDRTSGAPASEVSHSSAFTRDSAGRFWFGFKGGASLFLEARETLPSSSAGHPPALVFERVTTSSGRELDAPFTGVRSRATAMLGETPIVLPPGERTVRVQARAMSLGASASLRYQFRLEGLERDWSEPRPEGSREYVHLTPGSYRLEARARFAEGEWGAPASLALVLEPAWYERSDAKLAALLVGAAAVFAAAQIRTRRIAARNRALESEVVSRTDDLARYTRALEEHAHALDRANERIRLADRHRGEFLAKMSHELRTPLTSVLGFAALLADGLENAVEPRFLRYVQNIRESGNHLLRLINNLLDQAKIEAGRMEIHLERASVDSVVESALAMVEGFAATRSVRLRIERSGDLPLVTVDVAKLRQIVINLLSNAVKFAPKESEVEVRVGTLPEERSPLGVPAFEVVVADRGPGIDPDDHERIFEPFRQVAARGETLPGTGLGLPIARQFAALMGGVVGVAPREGGGSEFHVALPIEHAERTRGPAAPAGTRAGRSEKKSPRTISGVHALPALAEEPALNRPRVLVIEPDRGRFTALAAHLDRRGLLAVRAPDAEEGVRMLRELRPAVVALNLDPARVESWTSLLALDRERGRSAVPWVLYAFARGSDRGIAAGFDRCFVLPAEPAELVAALARGAEQRIGSHRPLSFDVVWIAAGETAVPVAVEGALDRARLSVCRDVPRSRALAEAAAGGFAAALIDLGDGAAGGFDLAFAGQGAARPPIAWVALLPSALPSAERHRLLDLAESSNQSAGLAVATAVERLLAL